MSTLTIALDMMGGDVGPSITFPAAIKAVQRIPQVDFLLFGQEGVLNSYLKRYKNQLSEQQQQRLIVHHCEQTIGMDESPVVALRTKKESSLRQMINAVDEGAAHACVSAGNTGALMATAFYVLKTLPGIDRPALVTAMPTANRERVFLLDLGANVTCSAETLFQYGVMGSVIAEQTANIEKPRVALLNVGEENNKGNAQVKLADQMFSECGDINYIGFVEGTELFSGTADVIVTDGFTGNVALKSVEGLAKLVINEVKRESQRSFFTRLMAKAAMPLLKQIYNRVNPDQYNGASLVGLRGTVIKSHGNASTDAFLYAIETAVQEAKMKVPEKIKASIEHVLLEQL